jgi:hypothetical protein
VRTGVPDSTIATTKGKLAKCSTKSPKVGLKRSVEDGLY